MEVKAPNTIPRRVFLAGSIEMGAAELWQDRATERLTSLGYIVLNPRRDDWDSSWEQTIDNPQFKEQVIWELQAMEQADVVLMHFDPNTKSPITLLELGILVRSAKALFISCPKDFYRRGNVEITLKFFHCSEKVYESLDSAIDNLLGYLGHMESLDETLRLI